MRTDAARAAMQGLDPVTVDVAVAHAGRNVAVEAVFPAEVRLRAGQPLHVRLRYHVEEASLRKDGYQFVLASRLGEVAAEPAVAVWGDTWGHRDQVEGAVRNIFTPGPGRWDLSFTATATHTSASWQRGGEQSARAAQAAGALSIIVE